MIQRILGCLALCGWLIAASSSLQAHHSLAGVYDMKKETECRGTVASIKFSNPHGSLYARGQESGRHDNRVGDDTWLRHGPRAERDW